jgi:hypothetical protein
MEEKIEKMENNKIEAREMQNLTFIDNMLP